MRHLAGVAGGHHRMIALDSLGLSRMVHNTFQTVHVRAGVNDNKPNSTERCADTQNFKYEQKGWL